jgi:hypothetical protein
LLKNIEDVVMLRSRINTPAGFVATLLIMLGAPAANAITIDLTSGNETNSGVLGNTWTFDSLAADDVTVTAWADLGQLDAGLIAANANMLAGEGLGVCTSAEGASNDASDISDCTSRDNRRSMDNAGDYDWLLILLPERMQIDSFVLDPDGNRKADVTYFTGVIEGAVDGLSYADLVNLRGMTRYDASNAKSTAQSTVLLADQNGGQEVYANAVLIGTSIEAGGSRFMVNQMQVTAVPIPAAMVMFMSSLGLLGFLRLTSII